MVSQAWPSEWLRGVLELCVLAIVSEGSTYGYAIAQRLEEADLGTVKGGTLYPLLNRLEAEGHLVSTWRAGEGGPGRKFYELTDDGRQQLGSQARLWNQFVQVTQQCINQQQEVP
jgi:PadR family transcriptional regulator PadR